MSNASDKITQFEANMALAGQIVNGDETTTVAVESGPCPTLRKTMEDVTRAFDAPLVRAIEEADRATTQANVAAAEKGLVQAEGDTQVSRLQAEGNAQEAGITAAGTNARTLIEGANVGAFNIPGNIVKRTVTDPNAALTAPGVYYTAGPLEIADGANLTIGDGVILEERGANIAAEIGFDFTTTGAPATTVQDMLVYLYNEIQTLKGV